MEGLSALDHRDGLFPLHFTTTYEGFGFPPPGLAWPDIIRQHAHVIRSLNPSNSDIDIDRPHE